MGVLTTLMFTTQKKQLFTFDIEDSTALTES